MILESAEISSFLGNLFVFKHRFVRQIIMTHFMLNISHTVEHGVDCGLTDLRVKARTKELASHVAGKNSASCKHGQTRVCAKFGRKTGCVKLRCIPRTLTSIDILFNTENHFAFSSVFDILGRSAIIGQKHMDAMNNTLMPEMSLSSCSSRSKPGSEVKITARKSAPHRFR